MYFDARLARKDESFQHAVEAALGVDKRLVVKALTCILGETGGVGIGGIVDAVLEVFARTRSEPYLVADEFNYLCGVSSLEAFSKGRLLLPYVFQATPCRD